ncbi:hypothetical protein E2562_016192 [Oryza meyeriana var. granulata]|uniref:Uncharacterized protein n=1 Tax=Oryza meyeriana var. granulata TaxID=110450 RepID=A0A6G1CQJ1_9ORYZ|nr:hypothetical protein E2562_016192 [Oryza meyeriana var. granulata]
MAMERFLTSLVFCEAPGLDVIAYAGKSLTAAVKVSTASTRGLVEPPVSAAPAEAKKDGTRRKECFSGEAPRRRQVAYEPAFDGLNCFETIVMR